MWERDLAKVATLALFGAILVNVVTHGDVFATLGRIIGNIWLGTLGAVAGPQSTQPRQV